MKKKLIIEKGFKKVLLEEASNNGIILTPLMLDRFEKYKNMLLEYNKNINLTAITDEYEIIVKHFVDCLECTKYIEKNTNIIDVGTGAGFPGIVICIFFDQEIEMTLLDSLNKRLVFLKDVVDSLKLQKVNIIHGRAEDIAKENNKREKYDYVVSRALANLPVLLEYIIPYIKVNGEAIIMKANNLEEELNNSKNALKVLNCVTKEIYTYNLLIENENFTRKIVVIKKINNTPNKYPRMYGKIKKQPL
jgi:16S rRNA (guanine527-N7)-methyltransferase